MPNHYWLAGTEIYCPVLQVGTERGFMFWIINQFRALQCYTCMAVW